MLKPHKHAAIIKAWADGAEIEIKSIVRDDWYPCHSPMWQHDSEYRVKPEKKADVVGYIRAIMPMGYTTPAQAQVAGLTSWCSLKQSNADNIKCTFDYETGQLKAVELIK